MTICWIRKCGCTFLKNVFFYLNTGHVYPNALGIHADEESTWISTFGPHETSPRDSTKCFVVVRDPVSRLVSFYWDKVYSQSPFAMKTTRQRLARLARKRRADFSDFDRSETLSLDGHIRNILATLDGIQEILSNPDKEHPDLHFALQCFAMQRSNAVEFTRLRLEDFRGSAPIALARVSPGFSDAVRLVPKAHESVKKFGNQDLLTDEVLERIREIYQDDIVMYQNVIAYEPSSP